MTINEILENENIKSDRYGMAAIAYIYKAFGNMTKFRELWPWTEIPTNDNEGFEYSITIAMQLLTRAKGSKEAENNQNQIKLDNSVSIENLKKRLSQINRNLKSANKNSTNINNTSTDVNNKSIEIIQ
jgi:hypothetical protein